MTSKFRHRIHFDKKYYGYSSGCRNRNNLFGGLGSIRFSIRSRDSFSVWDITTPIASLHVNDSRNGKHVQKNIWIWPQRETLVFVVTCSQVIAVKCSTVRRGRGSTVSAKILLVSNMKSAYKIPRSYFNRRPILIYEWLRLSQTQRHSESLRVDTLTLTETEIVPINFLVG